MSAQTQTASKAVTAAKNQTFGGVSSTTVLYTGFNVANLQLGQFEDKDFSPEQRLAQITHVVQNGPSFVQLQGPEMQIFSGGIPNAHPKYFPTDDKRMYVKIPEDTRNPNSVAFFAKLDALDAYMQSDEAKTKLFGKLTIAKAYEYQPIVRSPADDDAELDDEDAPKKEVKDKGPKPRFIKVKIATNYKSKTIETKIFVKDATGVRVRVPQDQLKTVDDVKSHIRFMSTIAPIIVAQKVYAQKNKTGNNPKKYGVTFKLHQVVCNPREQFASKRDEDEYIDEDDTNTHQLSSLNITPGATQDTVNVALGNDLDGNGGDDEEEEEDDTPAAPTVAAVVPAPVVQVPAPVVTTTTTAKPRGKRGVN
jgi:hypothetical protein